MARSRHDTLPSSPSKASGRAFLKDTGVSTMWVGVLVPGTLYPHTVILLILLSYSFYYDFYYYYYEIRSNTTTLLLLLLLVLVLLCQMHTETGGVHEDWRQNEPCSLGLARFIYLLLRACDWTTRYVGYLHTHTVGTRTCYQFPPGRRAEGASFVMPYVLGVRCVVRVRQRARSNIHDA